MKKINWFRIPAKCIMVNIIMVALFCLLGFISYSLPKSWIAANVVKSAELIEKDEMGAESFSLYHQDYHTDGLMLDIAVSGSGGSTGHWQESLDIPYYIWCDGTYATQAKISAQNDILQGDCVPLESCNYSRYWHGYLVPLRFAMCFVDLRIIRIVNYILLWGMACACLFLLLKRRSLTTALWFGISVIGVGLPGVAGCMQYSTCFYIMLISTVSVLLWKRMTIDFDSLSITMFVIGGFTSYLDFLVTPVITMGIPLSVAMMSWPEEKRLKGVAAGAGCWFIGYSGIWISKWIIGSLFIDPDVYRQAMDAVSYRTFYVEGLGNVMLKAGVVAGVLIISVISVYWIYIKRNISTKIIRSNRYLLILGVTPILWYMFLINHTLIHWVFTWRSIIVTLFCWGQFMINMIKSSENFKIARIHTDV